MPRLQGEAIIHKLWPKEKRHRSGQEEQHVPVGFNRPVSLNKVSWWSQHVDDKTEARHLRG
jgi:hypothetical protein